jgi:pyruvyltransferase
MKKAPQNSLIGRTIRMIDRLLVEPEDSITVYPQIKLFYWKPKGNLNFGDELGRTVVEFMLEQKGFTLSDEVRVKRKLIAVGSILHFAENNTVVWGSGRNGSIPDKMHKFSILDVRAVRGPRTKEFLKTKGIKVPDVFGDPGLLLPLLTKNRFFPSHKENVAFVPNLNDYKEHIDLSKITIPVINPMQSWNRVVSEIIKYKLILASSLHGLVVAEAFGIPARYVRLSEREGMFKYHDYYEGTGRILRQFPTSTVEALEMGGERMPVFSAENLLSSFPYDLWDM